MTTFNSVSDLARSYQLRNSQASLKAKLQTLTEETSTGVKSDIPLALGGDLRKMSEIESKLSKLKTYGDNLTEVDGIFSAQQNVLNVMQKLATASGTALMSDALSSSTSTLNLYIEKGPEDLKTALSALNTTVGGRYVFSGSLPDQAAVTDYQQMMDQITSAVGGATDAQQILERIDQYFSLAQGAGGYSDIGFTGSDQGNNAMAISEGRSISSSLSANSDAVRSTLKGFAVMAYLSEQPALDQTTQRSLSRGAGTWLIQGENKLIDASSKLGVQQEIAAKAQTANSAESSSLTIIRNQLIEADPYDTAAALKEVEANIQTLYTLTSRLSNLSLTDYL